MCFFARSLESLPPLPRQHSAAIGCTKKYQPKGLTVQSHYIESIEGLLQRCMRGRGCNNFEKKHTIFPEHPVYSCLVTFGLMLIFTIKSILGVESSGAEVLRGRLLLFNHKVNLAQLIKAQLQGVYSMLCFSFLRF